MICPIHVSCFSLPCIQINTGPLVLCMLASRSFVPVGMHMSHTHLSAYEERKGGPWPHLVMHDMVCPSSPRLLAIICSANNAHHRCQYIWQPLQFFVILQSLPDWSPLPRRTHAKRWELEEGYSPVPIRAIVTCEKPLCCHGVNYGVLGRSEVFCHGHVCDALTWWGHVYIWMQSLCMPMSWTILAIASDWLNGHFLFRFFRAFKDPNQYKLFQLKNKVLHYMVTLIFVVSNWPYSVGSFL